VVEASTLKLAAIAELRQVRRLRELEPLLYDREYCCKADLELPVYEIYRESCDDRQREIFVRHDVRYDVTVMPSLLLGEEYVKTIGHFHLPCEEVGSHPEVFEVLEGEARFLIQKGSAGEVVDVSLLVAGEGEKVLVPPGYGHVMINASSKRLVTGNLVSRNCVQVYDQYLERRGAAFYVLTGGRLVRNRRYSSVPEVRVLKPDTPSFLEGGSGLVQAFLKDPDRFAFLNEPSGYARQDAIS